MIRSLWIAKTGLDAQQTQLDVISNNLANVSTNGFKRSRAIFEDLLYQNLRQAGSQSSQTTQVPTGFMVGTGVRPVSTARMHTQGNLQQTGNNLDIVYNEDATSKSTVVSRDITASNFSLVNINATGSGTVANTRGTSSEASQRRRLGFTDTS